MPIVKQSWVKAPEALEKYLDKDRDSEPVRSASNGLAENMAKQIRDEHEVEATVSKGTNFIGLPVPWGPKSPV